MKNVLIIAVAILTSCSFGERKISSVWISKELNWENSKSDSLAQKAYTEILVLYDFNVAVGKIGLKSANGKISFTDEHEQILCTENFDITIRNEEEFLVYDGMYYLKVEDLDERSLQLLKDSFCNQ